jgi:hypothetical protein
MSLAAMSKSELLEHNLKWLQEAAPSLAITCRHHDNCLAVVDNSIISSSGEVLFDNSDDALALSVAEQMLRPSRVGYLRIRNTEEPYDLMSLVNDTFDRHTNKFLECLPSFSLPFLVSHREAIREETLQEELDNTAVFRDILVLGSLPIAALAGILPSLSEKDKPFSITLVESDITQLITLLCLIDLPAFVADCRAQKIGFNLIYNPEYTGLQEQLYSYLATAMPIAINGLQLITSPLKHPVLARLRGWIYSKSGLSPRYVATLGTTSDELNQATEAAWNILSHPQRALIAPVSSALNRSAVLVASGPSLDRHLDWLATHQDQLTIVAAGSSIGSLLRAGIRVDVAVQLERGSGVFDDMQELVKEGLPLDQVIFISSMTTDPRLTGLFKCRLFFHRPLATATALVPNEQEAYTLPHAGPEAANSALEILIKLGFSRLLLIGCDFAAVDRDRMRSAQAAGHSPRQLDIPMRGSHGRTVYSDASLVLVRDVFANTLRLFPHVQVERLGEGIEIAGSHTVELQDLDLNSYSSHKPDWEKICRELPNAHCSPQELRDLLSGVLQRLDEVEQEFKLLLTEASGWSIQLHRAFAPYFSYGLLQQDTAATVLVQRLWRQALFFMLQPLYDSSTSPVPWSQLVEEFLISYRYAARVFKGFFTVLLDTAKTAEKQPISPDDWQIPAIRKRIQEAASLLPDPLAPTLPL